MIASRFPEPEPEGPIQRLEEFRQCDAERPRDAIEHIEGWRLLPLLEIAQVRPVQTRAAGQFLLGTRLLGTQFLQPGAEGRPQIVHAGIVPTGSLPQP